MDRDRLAHLVDQEQDLSFKFDLHLCLYLRSLPVYLQYTLISSTRLTELSTSPLVSSPALRVAWAGYAGAAFSSTLLQNERLQNFYPSLRSSAPRRGQELAIAEAGATDPAFASCRRPLHAAPTARNAAVATAGSSRFRGRLYRPSTWKRQLAHRFSRAAQCCCELGATRMRSNRHD